jgi:hypothetical protein
MPEQNEPAEFFDQEFLISEALSQNFLLPGNSEVLSNTAEYDAVLDETLDRFFRKNQ